VSVYIDILYKRCWESTPGLGPFALSLLVRFLLCATKQSKTVTNNQKKHSNFDFFAFRKSMPFFCIHAVFFCNLFMSLKKIFFSEDFIQFRNEIFSHKKTTSCSMPFFFANCYIRLLGTECYIFSFFRHKIFVTTIPSFILHRTHKYCMANIVRR
jgi:hypothetical protein